MNYVVQIHLTPSDNHRPARGATVVGLLEDAEMYELLKKYEPGRPREDESVHFTHHTFSYDYNEATESTERVDRNVYYGGIGEGNKYDKWTDAIHCSLYDLYQTHGSLKDGDTFEVEYLGEKVEFACQGVHVVQTK